MSDLKILKEQIADDFQMTWKILGETADRLDRRIDRIVLDLQKLGGEMSEGLRQAQGRMRLLEERFGTFVRGRARAGGQLGPRASRRPRRAPASAGRPGRLRGG